MAGGKETPRQKMIGMMYLVLTAMLALNVSRSVLDAFVAIEENIQKANIVQAERGAGFTRDVRNELAVTKDVEQAQKKEKLEYVVRQMSKIDRETEEMIRFIDSIKLDMLRRAGEEVTEYKDGDSQSILWKKQEGVLPARMHCMAIRAKDEYNIPMLVLGINESIKEPKGTGFELWEKYNQFRTGIVELTGNYQLGGVSSSIKTVAINDFTDNADLDRKVSELLQKNEKTINLKDDGQVLKDLYMMLTKKERNEVHDQKDVHWIGMTFDHAPLVAAIASLSSLQQDILSARAVALAHWKGKVTVDEYSFNKITALAYGQPVANTGDSVYLRIMMAAYDSDNQPLVKIIEGPQDAAVRYPQNGEGIIGFKVGTGNEQVLKGTVAIKNKMGIDKIEPWEYKVTIMKPSGAISIPQFNVLYKGYENEIEAVASGFDQTILTGSVPIRKTTKGWIVEPPTGPDRQATLTVSGKNTVTGRTQQLITKTFVLKKLPKPDLYWGSAANGENGVRTETRVFARFNEGIPLQANFSIRKWTVSVSGLMGEETGSGNQLSKNATKLIEQGKKGEWVRITCDAIGPDKVLIKLVSVFKI